jgi:hypothetical protein
MASEAHVPALPVVPGVIKFTVEGTSDGSGPWVNVLHWSYTGTLPTGPTLNSFCASLLAAWNTNFAPVMDSSRVLTTVTAIDLSSASGAAGSASDALPGTRTGGILPASAAVVVSKLIARRYRGGHPRSYLTAGVMEDLDDASHWTTSLATAVDGAYLAVSTALAALAVGGTNLDLEACVSYFDTTSVPAPPHRRVVPLVEPVTGINVRLHIGTQRKRCG